MVNVLKSWRFVQASYASRPKKTTSGDTGALRVVTFVCANTENTTMFLFLPVGVML